MLATALLTYPTIDPVLIELGPFAVRWYALAYLAGILLGYYHIKQINAALNPPLMAKKPLDDMIVWSILGIILGGRLGYVIFYKPGYYLEHPLEALMIWQGGMAFHGGLLGVIIAFYLFSRRHQISYLRLMDLIACAAPIGLFFGRLSNFINGELFGRVSDCAVCMIFPHGGPFPRHPSQLYEAFLEGLLLFIVLWSLRKKTPILQRPGALSGLFLVGYAMGRATAELYREPDAHLGFILQGITMGQILCLPMALLGLYLLARHSLNRVNDSKGI